MQEAKGPRAPARWALSGYRIVERRCEGGSFPTPDIEIPAGFTLPPLTSGFPFAPCPSASHLPTLPARPAFARSTLG